MNNNTIIFGRISYACNIKAFVNQGCEVYKIINGSKYKNNSTVGKTYLEDMSNNDGVVWGTGSDGDHYVEYVYKAPEQYKGLEMSTKDALEWLRNAIKVDIERQMDELQQDYAAVENAQLIGG